MNDRHQPMDQQPSDNQDPALASQNYSDYKEIEPRAFQPKLRVCFPAGETFNSCQRVPECESILAGFEHSVKTAKFLRANRIYTSTQRHQRTDPNSALATSDPVCQRTGYVEQIEGHSGHPGFLLGRRQHTQLTRWTARASSCWIDRSDPVHNFLIRLRFHGCLCVLTFLLGDGRQSERHSTGDQAGTTSPSSQGSDQFRNMATIWLKSNARRLIASRHPQDAMGALFGQTHNVVDYGIVARLIDLELYEAALGRQQGQDLCSG